MPAKQWIPRIAICILAALQCYTFWAFPHFPSQDGPSHLYNAVVAADYAQVPVYGEYYELHPSPAGNLLAHWLLVGLVKMVAPALAEKLLLSFYAVLVPLSFWFFLKSVSPDAETFTLVSFLFLPSFFLYSGLWNFCFSLPLMLFALGAWLRGRHPWFAGLVMLVYLAHALSWMILALAVLVRVFLTGGRGMPRPYIPG